MLFMQGAVGDAPLVWMNMATCVLLGRKFVLFLDDSTRGHTT